MLSGLVIAEQVTIHHHAIMQTLHFLAAGFLKQEGQECMHKTHHTGHRQLEGERQRMHHVLAIAFIDLLQVLVKSAQFFVPPCRPSGLGRDTFLTGSE